MSRKRACNNSMLLMSLECRPSCIVRWSNLHDKRIREMSFQEDEWTLLYDFTFTVFNSKDDAKKGRSLFGGKM